MEINEITEKIIGASYNVANTLGSGFLEKVYENALVVELNLLEKIGLLINFGSPKVEIQRVINT